MKKIYLQLSILLLSSLPILINGQTIYYDVSITSVTWTGRGDSGSGNDDNEEYGLVTGLSQCISAIGDESVTTVSWSGNVVVQSGSYDAIETGPIINISYQGIENDPDGSMTLCVNDGGNDAEVCTVNGSLNVGTSALGTTTPSLSCNAGGGSRTVQINFQIRKSLTPLPVNLVSFKGRRTQKLITLSWQTATETNNDYMAVERSTDGKQFHELGRVRGAGTTQEPQEYTFVDENPMRGTNYYRLRQVDYDDAFEYHKVIAVEFTGKKRGMAVQAFPNPAKEVLQTSWAADGNQPTTLRLINMLGRELASYRLSAGDSSFELPLSKLPAGVYILQARQGEMVETMRFRKE